MKLQGKNIQIYKIIGKKFSEHNSIEFTLHKDVPYLQKVTANKIFLGNELPFATYKVGDHLGIDINRTSLRFSDVRGKVEKNSAVVARVVNNKQPSSHQSVYNSEEFGGGWVEE